MQEGEGGEGEGEGEEGGGSGSGEAHCGGAVMVGDGGDGGLRYSSGESEVD